MEKLVDCDTVSNIFFRLLFMPSNSSSGSSQLLQYYKILQFVDSMEYARRDRELLHMKPRVFVVPWYLLGCSASKFHNGRFCDAF